MKGILLKVSVSSLAKSAFMEAAELDNDFEYTTATPFEMPTKYRASSGRTT
jgi:hypothetical protein